MRKNMARLICQKLKDSLRHKTKPGDRSDGLSPGLASLLPVVTLTSVFEIQFWNDFSLVALPRDYECRKLSAANAIPLLLHLGLLYLLYIENLGNKFLYSFRCLFQCRKKLPGLLQ